MASRFLYAGTVLQSDADALPAEAGIGPTPGLVSPAVNAHDEHVFRVVVHGGRTYLSPAGGVSLADIAFARLENKESLPSSLKPSSSNKGIIKVTATLILYPVNSATPQTQSGAEQAAGAEQAGVRVVQEKVEVQVRARMDDVYNAMVLTINKLQGFSGPWEDADDVTLDMVRGWLIRW